MKEVTQTEFYQVISKLDVILKVTGNYPYTTEFKTRWGDTIKGKAVDYHPAEKPYPVQTKYYLAD